MKTLNSTQKTKVIQTLNNSESLQKKGELIQSSNIAVIERFVERLNNIDYKKIFQD